MKFYITLLAIVLLLGCSSHNIRQKKGGSCKQMEKNITVKCVDVNDGNHSFITIQREPFTPIKFRKIMKELEHTLFVDLESKLSRGDDWIEYDDMMQQNLKSFIKNSKKLKKFDIVKEDEEALKFVKKMIAYGYILEDIVKNRKLEYIKPAFNKIVHSCNQCHAMRQLSILSE